MLRSRVWLAAVLTAVLTALPSAARAQTAQPQITDNQWGGKTETWTDDKGRVTHQKAADGQKVVRSERFVEYPADDETEETINSYDARGRLTLTEKFKTKAGKRVSGTRTPRVYKDDSDPHGMPGEDMIIDPDTGNWTRPIAPANVSLQTADQPDDGSVSYTFKRFPGETYPVGVAADFSHRLTQLPSVTVRAVAAFEFYQGGNDSFTAMLGGARFGFQGTPTVSPFAEVTAGLVRWGRSDFAVQYGGGADVAFGRAPWKLRLAGGMASIFAGGRTFNAFRFAVGVSRTVSLGRHP